MPTQRASLRRLTEGKQALMCTCEDGSQSGSFLKAGLLPTIFAFDSGGHGIGIGMLGGCHLATDYCRPRCECFLGLVSRIR